ncbi:MAG: c-type cytochrome [Chloroflexi bacterium]|nr:c-type cytochrome [Chloroflexota bacterium]
MKPVIGHVDAKSLWLRVSSVWLGVLLLTACTGEVNGVQEPRTSSSDHSVQTGRTLIADYGCGSCHSIPGIPGADAKAAPPLEQFYQRTYIAGQLPNTLDNLVLWIQNPQEVEPGTAMPNLGVTQIEARAMAAYLYHQPTLTELLSQ